MNAEDLAQSPLEQDGVFRAFPIAWTVEQSTKEDSQSVAIAFRFGIAQKWHGKEQGWSVAWPAGYFVDNRTWIVKKDGSVNQGAVDALAKCGLWNGDFDALAGPCPTGFFVHVDVGAETFEGKTRYRANWINPDADEPQARGGFTPADASLLSSLRSRFQSQTRAIAGGGAKGAAPAPPAPTPAVAAPAAPGARPTIPGGPAAAAPRAAPAAPGAPGAGAATPAVPPRGPRPAIPGAATQRAQTATPAATGAPDDPIADDPNCPF